MNDQANTTASGEVTDTTADENTNTVSYPEVMTVADVKADLNGFMANVTDATGDGADAIPENRQFRNFDDPNALPDDYVIVIDPRDGGSFAADKNGAALFVTARPSPEAILAMGEKGLQFAKDCMESILSRKTAAYATGVNRPNGEYSAPLDLVAWLETAKPASTGVRAHSKKGWTAINGVLVDAINKLYKAGKSDIRINKKELLHCMANQSFAELSHPSIKAWDKIFSKAEGLILDLVNNPPVDDDGKPTVTLDAEKDTAILKHWLATREQTAAMPELEIVDLDV